MREKNTTFDSKPSRSFKSLIGDVLEVAIIDEVSQQTKSNQRIQLRNMEISKLTKNMLKKFPGIYSIDLRNNEIAEVEDETFSENSKLEKIDLMENRLTKITKNILAGDFEDLQEINFSYNMLASIEPGSFDKLPHLESIDLSCNCLKHLHSDIFKKSPDLRQVHFQENEIDKIESALFNSKTDLKFLDLSKNKLEFIPNFEMKNIKLLDLSFNKITLLDLNYNSHEKKKSASIAELNLANNDIKVCLELEERRTDILHLDLTHNALENLDDFPSFLNLEVLILAKNNLTDLSLHNFEDRFPSLKVFNFRENPIECEDYRYVRNNLQSLVILADTSITHRCHNNKTATNSNELDDYEDPIINEIRLQNREVVIQLKTNRLLIVILLSSFFICAMICATFFLIKYRINIMKRAKGNLIDQMEL